MALRAIPNLMDLRPGDPAETAVAWKVAVERRDGPAFLALTRQKVPVLDRGGDDAGTLASAEGLRRGGYVLAEGEGGEPRCILIASGSELHLAVEAREVLQARGIPTRVVSLPSWFLFEQQEESYRDAVLPPSVTARVAVEAGSTFGWARYVGRRGTTVGLDRFGASAPAEILFERFGITAADVAARAESLTQAGRPSANPA